MKNLILSITLIISTFSVIGQKEILKEIDTEIDTLHSNLKIIDRNIDTIKKSMDDLTLKLLNEIKNLPSFTYEHLTSENKQLKENILNRTEEIAKLTQQVKMSSSLQKKLDSINQIIIKT